MRQAGEPSVEEILESIKKVIARDNRAEADQVRQRREQAGIVSTRTLRPEDYAAEPVTANGVGNGENRGLGDDEPVLELTEAELAPGPETGADALPPRGEEDGGDDYTEDEGLDEAGDEIDEPVERPEQPLVAETARASMRESLAALAMLSEPGAQPQIVRSGETSLEALTRDLLRPMLAQWLEKNLPPMVDKLVAAEISRIVGKRG